MTKRSKRKRRKAIKSGNSNIPTRNSSRRRVEHASGCEPKHSKKESGNGPKSERVMMLAEMTNINHRKSSGTDYRHRRSSLVTILPPRRTNRGKRQRERPQP